MAFFSVVTATFNRGDLIHRVFESLMEQSFKDFEWVVVDDGSEDNTESVISGFESKSFFDIKYIKTDNAGKASALNTSLEHCDGVLYLVIDSDDWCDSNALDVLYQEYAVLQKMGVADEYFAISSLKRYQNGKVVGDDYSKLEKYGMTYIDRLNRGVVGDKWECLFFDKIKGHYYPIALGEKYMAPGYLYLILARDGYKTVFVNKSLSVVEYQFDGISRNSLRHRMASLSNTIRYYRYVYMSVPARYTIVGRWYANLVRFSFHASKFPSISIRYFPFYIVGLILFLVDKGKGI